MEKVRITYMIKKKILCIIIQFQNQQAACSYGLDPCKNHARVTADQISCRDPFIIFTSKNPENIICSSYQFGLSEFLMANIKPAHIPDFSVSEH